MIYKSIILLLDPFAKLCKQRVVWNSRADQDSRYSHLLSRRLEQNCESFGYLDVTFNRKILFGSRRPSGNPFGKVVFGQEFKDARRSCVFSTCCREFSTDTELRRHSSFTKSFTDNTHNQIIHDCFRLVISIAFVPLLFESRLPFKDQSFIQSSNFRLEFTGNENRMNKGLISLGIDDHSFMGNFARQDGIL